MQSAVLPSARLDDGRILPLYEGLRTRVHQPLEVSKPTRILGRVPETEISRAVTAPRARWRSRLATLRQGLDVTIALSTADLRTRYGRGAGRIAKWLLDPFALAGVYLLLVTFVLGRPGEAPGLRLACAIVPFQLVMASVQFSVTALEMRQAALLNMAYERSLIPVATVLTECAAFVASLSLIGVTMAAYGVAPTAAVLWLPVLFGVTVTLALGLAYPAMLFGVWFPNLRVLAVNAVRALFFLSPGLVALSATPESSEGVLRLNPFTGIFEAYRSVFVSGESPSAGQLLYPALVGVALLAVFIPLYRFEQAQLAKVIG